MLEASTVSTPAGPFGVFDIEQSSPGALATVTLMADGAGDVGAEGPSILIRAGGW